MLFDSLRSRKSVQKLSGRMGLHSVCRDLTGIEAQSATSRHPMSFKPAEAEHCPLSSPNMGT